MTEASPFDLPHLDEIFDVLRRGRHLCAADGKLYWALRENLDAYQDFFIISVSTCRCISVTSSTFVVGTA